MSVTGELLKLFMVDKQIRGLRSRLNAAERFLGSQQTQLGEIGDRLTAIDAETKRLKVVAADGEGETKRIDERMETLREQMNNCGTTREYNALLTELNKLKEEKAKIDENVLEAMSKIDALAQEKKELQSQGGEREAIVTQATSDRDAKAQEIKDRLDELTDEREQIAAELPDHARRLLDELIDRYGDEAMAPIEAIDARNMEYSCSSCMMAVPIESVSGVLTGRLVQCVSCQCIQYVPEDMDLGKAGAKKKKTTKKKTSSKKAKAEQTQA